MTATQLTSEQITTCLNALARWEHHIEVTLDKSYALEQCDDLRSMLYDVLDATSALEAMRTE